MLQQLSHFTIEPAPMRVKVEHRLRGRPLLAPARSLRSHEPIAKTELHEIYRKGLQLLKARQGNSPLGDYLAFGVGRGASMVAMWAAVREEQADGIRLFGFDGIGLARLYLTIHGVERQRASLVNGRCDRTLTAETARSFGLKKASIIMIDCDQPDSALKALRFCRRLIWDRAIVVLADGRARGTAAGCGAKTAFEAFLLDNPDLTASRLECRSVAFAVYLLERDGGDIQWPSSSMAAFSPP